MTPPLAWFLLLAAALAGGAVAYVLLGRRRKSEPSLPREWSLTPRPIFNAHERRVYRQLREALPEQVVLAKLPLVRFCHPTDPNQVRYWFELLGATHVSFAICSASGRVLAAIDIDDGRGPAHRSVQIKQGVLAACQIRYVRYNAEHTPSVPELQLLVPAAAAMASPMPTVGTVRTGTRPAPAPPEARSRGRALHWPDSVHRRDSAFGRDSVISGFSHSLPSTLPERGGEVIDTPPTRH
jgi:hypothetical protein